MSLREVVMQERSTSEKELSEEPSLSARKQVAELLNEVLNDTSTPRQVFNRWPCRMGADRSLDAVYQALLHFESDEDEQKGDVFYLDVQLQLLEQMRGFLEDDEPLPEYMLQAYSAQHQTGYYDSWGVFSAPFRVFGRVMAQLAKQLFPSFFKT